MRAALRGIATLLLVWLCTLVTACGGGSGGGDVAISIELTGGKAAAVQRIDVKGGAKVTLTIKSDADDVVHVHGYDLEFPVSAKSPVTKEFVADQLGSYEIETHKSGQIIAQLVVR